MISDKQHINLRLDAHSVGLDVPREQEHGEHSWENRDKNANYFEYSNRNRYFGMFDVDWDVALSYQFLKCLQVTLQTSLKYYPGWTR